MKITNIEIKNFRAFPKTYRINLSKAGKNLLVYGENGSGKSSLYLALKYFLESSVDEDKKENKNTGFESHQNIFFIEDLGHIKLRFRAEQPLKKDTYKWSEDHKETNDDLIIEISKASGFLDYKDLLGVHYLQPEGESVNVFDLLVEPLLANTVNPVTDRTLAEAWGDIQEPYPRRSAKHQIASLKQRVEVFNDELVNRLADLRPKVREILGKFGYKVDLNLDFKGVTYDQKNKTLENQQVLLNVKFFDKDISERYLLLNEAKLSAIAISIYLSSILLLPDPRRGLRILALDDVLIGLDMSNRLPVLDMLLDKKYFLDYQIFLTTYDKIWYEIVKQRTNQKDWKTIEFYFKETDKNEMPVCTEDKPYLKKAKEYFDGNDYKACAIYLRTAFEAAIKRFCERKNLAVRYCENPKDLKSQYFWDPIKSEKKKCVVFPENDILFVCPKLVDQIELARKFILNELSHATLVNIYRKELKDAIVAVERLEVVLA